MTTVKNDITGDNIATKSNSDAYRDGWERIFGKKKPATPAPAKGPKPGKKKSANLSTAWANRLR